MSKSSHHSLASLKAIKGLTNTVVSKPKAAASPRTTAPAVKEDAHALFLAATQGSQSLRNDGNRVELKKAPPAPIPRARETSPEAPRAQHGTGDWIPKAWRENGPSTSLDPLSQALQGVQALPTRNRVEIAKPKPAPRPLQHQRDEAAALHESLYAPTPLDLVLEGGDELHYLKAGLPRRLVGDLRRGRWVVEAALDLHGANRDEARDRLAIAMAEWRKHEVRCVRIIHGKGLGSPGKSPVLKGLVAGWLINYEHVLAYAQARVHDGGAGALLVLMQASKPRV